MNKTREMGLPIQNELRDKATEVLIALEDARKQIEAIAESYETNCDRAEETTHIEYKRLLNLSANRADLGYFREDSLKPIIPDNFVTKLESTKGNIEKHLLYIERNIAKYFPEVLHEEVFSRWSEETLIDATRSFILMTSRTKILKVCCDFSDKTQSIFDLYMVLGGIKDRLISSRYGDQFIQCQITLLDRHRMIMDKQTRVLEAQSEAADAQTRIAESAEAESKSMTKMTKRILVFTAISVACTAVSLAIAVYGAFFAPR